MVSQIFTFPSLELQWRPRGVIAPQLTIHAYSVVATKTSTSSMAKSSTTGTSTSATGSPNLENGSLDTRSATDLARGYSTCQKSSEEERHGDELPDAKEPVWITQAGYLYSSSMLCGKKWVEEEGVMRSMIVEAELQETLVPDGVPEDAGQ